MFMRTLPLVAVVWSFVAMPALCRAGVLVECCASEVPVREKSHDAPDECPGKCPDDNREKCPDSTGSSGPRDCDSCAEACNAVSPHSRQISDDDIAFMSVTVIAVTPIPGDAYLLHQHRSPDPSTVQLREHLPIPVSDRPLLI
jgi:hypothetical protein